MVSRVGTPKAYVQWWDGHGVAVLCPSCDEIHHHNFDGDYARRHTRLAHCNPIRNGRLRSVTYKFEFPMDSPKSRTGFEMDKRRLRFVAAGARVPQDDDLTDDEADRRRAAFETQIKAKSKWTEAVETEIVYKDFALNKVVNTTSQMILGNVQHVREYLETSKEASIFLHGVESWDRGITALHLAACEAFPDMVKLLLSKGANANAADINGRTPLMEAALWGRLENVEALLEHGADKTLTCVEGNRLLRAADLAKPFKENARLRGARAGSLYKEDTLARDRDRRDIVRVLDDATDEPIHSQLNGFAFRQTPGNNTLLSQITVYSLPNERKTVASMCRGGGLPEVSAMSGWSHLESESIQVSGRDWTSEVLRLCKVVGFMPQSDFRDGGVPGRFNACHAEKQLVAYFVHKHVFLQYELDIPDELSDDLQLLFQLLDLEGLTEEEIERRQAERVRRENERKYRITLHKLWGPWGSFSGTLLSRVL